MLTVEERAFLEAMGAKHLPDRHDQRDHGRRRVPKLPDAAPDLPSPTDEVTPPKPREPKPKPPASARRSRGVRPELAAAANVEELAKAASTEAKRITGKDTDFDFTGSHLGIAREHAEGVLRGFERYPTARLSAVRVEKLRDGVFAKVEDRKEGTVMLFSAKESADAKRYRDYARMEKQYKVKATGSPMGTALHEFGHVVANQYQANGKVRSEAGRARDFWGYSETSTLVRDQLSSYATDNEYELSAEAFADVLMNGDKASSLSRRLVAVIDEAIRTAVAP